MNHFIDDKQISDTELLGLFVVNDDQEAFKKLIQRHAPMVMNVCRSFLWNSADCEDSVQAVFLLLARKSKALMRHSSIGGWLHTVAVNESQNRRRRIFRQREVAIEHDPKASNPEPWESIAEAQQSEALHLEVSRLPKFYRDVIVLCHLNGMSRAEAANNLETTTSAVKAGLARARKTLRRKLIRKGIGLTTVLAATTASTSDVVAGQQVVHLANAVQGTLSTAGASASVASNMNLVQLITAKGISAMPIGIVNSSLVAAIGLVSVGAIALGVTDGANGPSGTGRIETVVVQQEVQEPGEPEAIEIEKGATKTDPAESELGDSVQESNALIETIDQQLLELEQQLSAAKGKYADRHPKVQTIQMQIDALHQGRRKHLQKSDSKQQATIGDSRSMEDSQNHREVQLRILETQIALEQAKQRFGKEHPNVQSLEAQISLLEKFFERAQAKEIAVPKNAQKDAAKTEAIVDQQESDSKQQVVVQDLRSIEDLRLGIEDLLPTKSKQLKRESGTDHLRIKAFEQQIKKSLDRELDIEVKPRSSSEVENSEPNKKPNSNPVIDDINLQIMYLETMRKQLELTDAKQRLGKDHPTVLALEAKVRDMEEFTKATTPEYREKVDRKTAEISRERAQKLFSYKPKQTGAEYSQPATLDGIVVVLTKYPRGYEATDQHGNVLRRFLDKNRDNQLDTWIYFKNGRETYRDIDRDFDDKVDEVQFTSGDVIRIGKDTNGDASIDSWSERRLSDVKR